MFNSSIVRKFYVAAIVAVFATSLVWLGLLSGLLGRFGALNGLPVQLNAMGRVALLAFLLAALPALVVCYWLAQTVVHDIRGLQRSADAILKGSYTSLPTSTDDELSALEASLNRVASQWSETVDRLQVASDRAAAILSSMIEGVLAVDGYLHVLFCNDAFTKAIHLKGRVAAGTPLRQLTRDPNLIRVIAAVLESAKTVEHKWTIRGDGIKVFEVQATPLVISGSRCALVIFHETTRLEQLERVRQDFVANVSHELRTPLASILGYAETLLDGGLEDAQHNRKFLEIIRSQAIRLTDIAADLLTLASLDAEARVTALEPVSLRAVIDAAVHAMELEASTREVQVAVEDFEDVELQAERVKLEQAFLNLISNAVKFNRRGGQVHVTAKKSNENVQVIVRDTGIGIPSEHLPRLFERFYRVDKGRSRAVGGTGLGLSIVKHAIEDFGGTVAVESQFGKGSVFTVTLPLPKL